MKKALVFTAYDRLRYLQNTLFSWETVRGLDDWHVVFRVEPSDITEHVVDEFRLFAEKMNLQDYEIIVNSTKLGVLLHPFVAFDSLFAEGYDFVARVEDDVIVSDDILEYFDSMAKSYRDDPKVATVCAFTETQGYEDAVYTDSYFDPLNWGTWSDRWKDSFETHGIGITPRSMISLEMRPGGIGTSDQESFPRTISYLFSLCNLARSISGLRVLTEQPKTSRNTRLSMRISDRPHTLK